MKANEIVRPNFRDYVNGDEASRRVSAFELVINNADKLYRDYYKDRVDGDGLLSFTRTAIVAAYLMSNGSVFHCGKVTKVLTQHDIEQLMIDSVESVFFSEYSPDVSRSRLCNMYRDSCMFDSDAGEIVWGITKGGMQLIDDVLAVSCGYRHEDLPFVVARTEGTLQ